MISIEMPGLPVPKGRPKFARIGRGEGSFVTTYTPSETRSYETGLKLLAKTAMKGQPPWRGACAIHVIATRPLLKSFSGVGRQRAIDGLIRPITKPDADNYLKIAADACTGIVYVDDAQLVDQHVSKIYGEYPGLLITINPIE